jgi:acrylyl-CoA reductase (NADPH)
MNKSFRAYRVHQDGENTRGRLETLNWDDLTPNEVMIEGHFSSVNFKDALAGTGKGKIMRRYPCTAGIDMAGTVVSAKAGGFQKGDPVLVTGCGIGEAVDGGYAEFLSVPAASVVPLPKGLTLEESMIIGTAGFSAALALYRLEQNGQTPQKGPVVISGASGGVGSIATDILASQGYEVWAVSGKESARDFLKELGARKVLAPQQLELGHRPLETVRFAGAIDNVGGDFLAGILRHIELWGNVAAVGLAADHEFKATVMPFILRGVSLLGVSSNNTPRELRLELWKRLAGLWKPKHLRRIHAKTITLDQLDDAFAALMDRKAIGRVVVDLRRK